MKKLNAMRIFLIVLVLAIVGALGFTTYYFYNQYKRVKTNPSLVSQQETKDLTAKIAKFMELPNGEEPTLATVTDREKLKEQPFFAKAENGDKVLIYTKSRKAILYRASVNKVIEVAPLTIGNVNSEAVITPTISKKIRVAIYNGSTLAGLTKEIEKKIADIEGVEVGAKQNAVKNDYSQTVVVDLNGNYSDIVSGMAQILNGVVSTLPLGEIKPDADVLIIGSK